MNSQMLSALSTESTVSSGPQPNETWQVARCSASSHGPGCSVQLNSRSSVCTFCQNSGWTDNPVLSAAARNISVTSSKVTMACSRLSVARLWPDHLPDDNP